MKRVICLTACLLMAALEDLPPSDPDLFKKAFYYPDYIHDIEVYKMADLNETEGDCCLEVKVGDQGQLVYEQEDLNVDGVHIPLSVAFESSDDSIARILYDGRWEAVAEGDCYFSATIQSDPNSYPENIGVAWYADAITFNWLGDSGGAAFDLHVIVTDESVDDHDEK